MELLYCARDPLVEDIIDFGREPGEVPTLLLVRGVDDFMWPTFRDLPMIKWKQSNCASKKKERKKKIISIHLPKPSDRDFRSFSLVAKSMDMHLPSTPFRQSHGAKKTATLHQRYKYQNLPLLLFVFKIILTKCAFGGFHTCVYIIQ